MAHNDLNKKLSLIMSVAVIGIFILIYFLSVFFGCSTISQSDSPETPVRRTDKAKSAPEPEETAAAAPGKEMIAGTNEGLFAFDSSGNMTALYTGGSVGKILHADGDTEEFWVILGSEGILVSNDLQNWEKRNSGLPVKTLKTFQNGNKAFLQIIQEIKDLEICPENQNIFTCTVNNGIYLSRDQGKSWKNLGMPVFRNNGIKAVAAAYLPLPGSVNSVSELTVFCSHSIAGIYYIHPDRRGAEWIHLVSGLERIESTANPDEVSDIAVKINFNSDGTAAPEIFVSQTFRRRIYKLDWEKKTFNRIWSDNSIFGTAESLDGGLNALRFLSEGTASELDYTSLQIRERRDIIENIRAVKSRIKPNCIVIKDSEKITLSELWLLDEKNPNDNASSSKRGKPGAAGLSRVNNREGIYLPVNIARDEDRLHSTMELMKNRDLDMIVIDMKDDNGRLRFIPNNPDITAKGRVVYPIDIDLFLRDMKERGIFTVARLVVFKDPILTAYEKGKYAVWDVRNDKPWQGYYNVRRKKTDIKDSDRSNPLYSFSPDDDPEYENVRVLYDENWVDPYSEEVWEYNAQIAVELQERGFDEIQFDYIRFPTDGINIYDARYRWQDKGMDMESAMLSFLRHARSRIKGIISIDIYGSNGWYRTGTRTGQDVELLAPWVDIICPMYYPSHFEQNFLVHSPPELRPWRIYYYGTLRASRISRGQAIIRPWVQAFYLNVSYDREYYNIDYIRRQVEGVRTAGSGGLTYWNNRGRYEDVPESW